MYIIKAIPLLKGGFVTELSYFSKISYPIGTFLQVPIRNKLVPAIIIHTEPVSSAKTILRSATFSLKKLPEQTETRALSPEMLRTVERLSVHFAASTQSILLALLPNAIKDGDIPLPHTPYVEPHEQGTVAVLQSTYKERIRTYRTSIREAFARSGSMVIVAPTTIEATLLADELKNGIEDRTILIANANTKQQRDKNTEKLEDFSTAKLIITTPSYALFDRHDIITIIIEHEHSPHWIQRVYPYLDFRDVLRIYAEETGRSLIIGDILPRTETEYQRRIEAIDTIDESPKRIAFGSRFTTIRMSDKPKDNTPFKLFNKKVIEAIEQTVANKGRVFLFAARRGLAPVVACLDCGHIFRSEISGAPYSLIRIKKGDDEERWFVDATSGKRVRAADGCPVCESWRIRERGIGIQSAYDELSKLVSMPLMVFDHLTANTYKKARFLGDKFQNTNGAVMLGTNMALPYIGHDIDTCIIINTDALRATPTWKAQEDAFAHILELRDRTKGVVYAQTRVTVKAVATEKDDADGKSVVTDDGESTDELLELARTAHVERFYTEEIASREQFKYPPFAHFILLTWNGEKNDVKNVEEKLSTMLAIYKPLFYSGPPSGDTVIRHTLLRLKPEATRDATLSKLLQSLPQRIKVTINPQRII